MQLSVNSDEHTSNHALTVIEDSHSRGQVLTNYLNSFHSISGVLYRVLLSFDSKSIRPMCLMKKTRQLGPVSRCRQCSNLPDTGLAHGLLSSVATQPR